MARPQPIVIPGSSTTSSYTPANPLELLQGLSLLAGLYQSTVGKAQDRARETAATKALMGVGSPTTTVTPSTTTSNPIQVLGATADAPASEYGNMTPAEINAFAGSDIGRQLAIKGFERKNLVTPGEERKQLADKAFGIAMNAQTGSERLAAEKVMQANDPTGVWEKYQSHMSNLAEGAGLAENARLSKIPGQESDLANLRNFLTGINPKLGEAGTSEAVTGKMENGQLTRQVYGTPGASVFKVAKNKLGQEIGAPEPTVDYTRNTADARLDTRLDKSFQYNNSELVKVAKPIEDASTRLGRLKDTLAQGSPQSDALVAPELLTVMAGGQGSGLRMNEAEIARIIGGRSKWEDLKAFANKVSLDPKAANSITPEQRTQIKSLVDVVSQKLDNKRKIIEDANQSLVYANDVQEHRKIVANTRKKLLDIDTNAQGDNQGSGGGTIQGAHGSY